MNRVVSLLPSNTEIICALGCRDRLVGRSHECDHPSGVDALPVCTEPRFDPDGTSCEIDQRVKEVLLETSSVYRIHAGLLDELAPDLLVTQSHCEVCAAGLDDVRAAARQLVRSRPEIISVAPDDLGEVWENITEIAGVLGVGDRGAELVARLQERLARIATISARAEKRPRVACVEWYDPLMAAGNWVPELVEIAGGEDVLGVKGEHSAWIEWDALTAADPDVIVLMPCGFDIGRSRRELCSLAEQSAWGGLRAVREESVFVADGNQYFNRPGPRLVESAEIMAEILHPGQIDFGHAGHGWQPL